jgi:hypothetical protein
VPCRHEARVILINRDKAKNNKEIRSRYSFESLDRFDANNGHFLTMPLFHPNLLTPLETKGDNFGPFCLLYNRGFDRGFKIRFAYFKLVFCLFTKENLIKRNLVTRFAFNFFNRYGFAR